MWARVSSTWSKFGIHVSFAIIWLTLPLVVPFFYSVEEISFELVTDWIFYTSGINFVVGMVIFTAYLFVITWCFSRTSSWRMWWNWGSTYWSDFSSGWNKFDIALSFTIIWTTLPWVISFFLSIEEINFKLLAYWVISANDIKVLEGLLIVLAYSYAIAWLFSVRSSWGTWWAMVSSTWNKFEIHVSFAIIWLTLPLVVPFLCSIEEISFELATDWIFYTSGINFVVGTVIFTAYLFVITWCFSRTSSWRMWWNWGSTYWSDFSPGWNKFDIALSFTIIWTTLPWVISFFLSLEEISFELVTDWIFYTSSINFVASMVIFTAYFFVITWCFSRTSSGRMLWDWGSTYWSAFSSVWNKFEIPVSFAIILLTLPFVVSFLYSIEEISFERATDWISYTSGINFVVWMAIFAAYFFVITWCFARKSSWSMWWNWGRTYWSDFSLGWNNFGIALSFIIIWTTLPLVVPFLYSIEEISFELVTDWIFYTSGINFVVGVVIFTAYFFVIMWCFSGTSSGSMWLDWGSTYWSVFSSVLNKFDVALSFVIIWLTLPLVVPFLCSIEEISFERATDWIFYTSGINFVVGTVIFSAYFFVITWCFSRTSSWSMWWNWGRTYWSDFSPGWNKFDIALSFTIIWTTLPWVVSFFLSIEEINFKFLADWVIFADESRVLAGLIIVLAYSYAIAWFFSVNASWGTWWACWLNYWSQFTPAWKKFELVFHLIIVVLTLPWVIYFIFFLERINLSLTIDWMLLVSFPIYALVLYSIFAYTYVQEWFFRDTFMGAVWSFRLSTYRSKFTQLIKSFVNFIVAVHSEKDFRGFLLPVIQQIDIYAEIFLFKLDNWDKLTYSDNEKPTIGRWYFLKPYPRFSSLFFKSTSYAEMFFYSFIKTFLVSLSVGLIIFLYLVYFFQLQFLKQLALWFIVLNIFFWLMSGFNFFLKRYRYGKFTSAIQRFWKRTNICFWLVEGFLFVLFFYYFLNSSQEPIYMYDSASLNQEYLTPLPGAYASLVLLAIIVFLLNYVMLSLTSLTFFQTIGFLILISSIIFFSFFLESYQFYYVLGTFQDFSWVFSEEEGLWELEGDPIRLRTKQYYFLMCLIAKYWHFIFIFLSWVFFLLKTFESKRITYNLLAFNTQNIIVLYVLNLLCYVQWLKWVGRRFLDIPYQWFFVDPDGASWNTILNEFIVVIKSLVVYYQYPANIYLHNYMSQVIYLPDYLCSFSI